MRWAAALASLLVAEGGLGQGLDQRFPPSWAGGTTLLAEEDDGSLPDDAVESAAPPPAGPSATSPSPGVAAPPKLTIPAIGEVDRWDRHVRGFRREHNFALAAGMSSGTWHVKSFGTLSNEDFPARGAWSKFQYTYHIPIYSGFGYLLGSSAGYHYESANNDHAFRPVSCYEFPGVMAGLVMNFNPRFRLSVAADVYLERYNGIGGPDSEGNQQQIAITLAAYDGGVFFDVFYDLPWAVRIEGHKRHLDYERPNSLGANGCRNSKGDQAPCPVDVTFSKNDGWLGLGIVYHLL
jgi:hypothetical protein